MLIDAGNPGNERIEMPEQLFTHYEMLKFIIDQKGSAKARYLL